MPHGPLASTETILDALRPEQSATTWRTVVETRNVAWNDLVVRAIVLGIAPQLHHRLQAWQFEAPPTVLTKLKVAYVAQRHRSAAIYAQLDELLQQCAAHAIEPIALKGVHLAEHVYDQPALRPMNDIDLLFREDQLQRAQQLLAELGYGGKHKDAASGAGVTKHTSTFKREGAADNTPNPFLSTSNERMIEPHTSLEESWYGLKVDITPGVRERARLLPFGAQQCRVLANEDLLLHIAVHFCFHLIEGAPALVQLCDVAQIVEKVAVDWSLLIDRAQQRRAAPFLLAALTLAERTLSAPVAPDTMTTLRRATPSHLRRRIEQMTLADVVNRMQRKPLHTIGDRLRQGLADRAATARWAADWSSRIRIWGTVFGRSDTLQLLLSKQLKTELGKNS